MELIKSKVVFNEEDHSYSLEGRKLIGITGLIHEILGLGVYPDADDYAKGYLIPRAGSRGTAVHHAIQTYDTLGIRDYIQKVRTVYFDGARVQEEEWDVSNELETYITHCLGAKMKPIANEYTVSDGKKWASQIDNVWQWEETGGIWLVDTKTNNLERYPLCGYFNPCFFQSREQALKEYLSWQLSIYAELFELQNPGKKVEGLACNWLRPDRGEYWIIERKPSELVRELLSSDWMEIDGKVHYYHHDPSVFGIQGSWQAQTLPATVVQTLPEVTPDIVEYVKQLLEEEKRLKAEMETIKEGLRKAMETHGVKSFDFGSFKATIGADSLRASFDSARFKQDHPELYEKYVKRNKINGSFTLKAK